MSTEHDPIREWTAQRERAEYVLATAIRVREGGILHHEAVVALQVAGVPEWQAAKALGDGVQVEHQDALAKLAEERDDARRAHIRSVFGSGNRAFVHNLEAGIRATECHTHHAVAVVWYGDEEADRLYPGERPCPNCDGTGWASESNPGTGGGTGRDEQIAVECPRGCPADDDGPEDPRF